MYKFWLVFVGGGLGAVSRYGVTVLAVRLFGAGFPWGTLAVNVVGCFLIGLLFELAERTALISPAARLLLMTGFLGGLTTFSAFGLESWNALRQGESSMMAVNVLANNVIGLLAVGLGTLVVRMLK